MVKESLDEGYCDISGRVGDLDLVGTSCFSSPDFHVLTHTSGEMGDVKIYVSRGGIHLHL